MSDSIMHRRFTDNRFKGPVVFLAIGSIGLACQHPLAASDGGDAGLDSGAVDAPVTDSPAADTLAADVPNANAPLSYMPMGCNYTVTTTPGTTHNQMGDNSTFGPMPMPQNVHVTWASDPSSTAAFLWSTDQATLATVVQYGTSPTSMTQMAIGHVTSAGGGTSVVHMHEVHVCGLAPDTTYYYEVGGTGNFSATQTFHTAPMPGDTTADVNFVVSGDSRDDFTVWQMVQSEILTLAGAQTPDFQIFSGDAVPLGTIQSAWDQWFAGATQTLSKMPFVFVQGNHDDLALNYLVQIAQPQFNNPFVQDELYYSLNYGPIHLVVLNDTPYMGDYAGIVAGSEVTFLQSDLAAVDRTRTPWVIVSHHKPAFSSSMHSMDTDTLQVRMAWPPVYAQYGVDVVFNGHDHDFEVTHPLLGDGSIAMGQRGTVYVTAAGAGASLYPSATSTFTQYSESVVNFVLVHVTATSLQLSPYRIDGTLISQGQVSLTRP